MTDPGEPSKRRTRKRKRIDYMAIANQLAASSPDPDPMLQICRRESLDSYARLQSLLSGMVYCFSISIEAKLCLDNDWRSQVVPSEQITAQHVTESHPNDPTTYDIDEYVFDAHSNSLEHFSLPSWKEISLPGHEHRLPDGADDLEGSPSDLDCLLRDTVGDNMADGEYQLSEDDYDEILSEPLSREDEARDAMGNFKCSYVSSFHLALN